MTTIIPIVACILAVFGCVATVYLCFRHVEATTVASRARERAYLVMIRDLHNRLTAKDLNGYIALKSAEQQIEPPPAMLDRSDEEEWLLEQERMGLTPQRRGAG